MVIIDRLKNIVADESLLWGREVADTYHAAAADAMDHHWDQLIWPMISHYSIDFSRTLELGCGYGRNSRKLLEIGASALTLVDVNPDNISYCQKHIQPLGNVSLVQNNGIDLSTLDSQAFTFVYTFDSMVHFDLELVISYVEEFSRVIKVGGFVFMHHSNYSSSPGSDFRKNPHWRNFMSAGIMRHIAIRNKFEVIEQKVIDWGKGPRMESKIDCLSLLKRS